MYLVFSVHGGIKTPLEENMNVFIQNIGQWLTSASCVQNEYYRKIKKNLYFSPAKNVSNYQSRISRFFIWLNHLWRGSLIVIALLSLLMLPCYKVYGAFPLQSLKLNVFKTLTVYINKLHIYDGWFIICPANLAAFRDY